MSKKIIGIALVIVGVALQAIPGIGQAIGLPMIAAGISSAAVIGLGLTIAGSLLMSPGKPKLPKTSAVDRLYASFSVTTPRKWVFGGPTAMATDVRYQAYTGSKQDTYWQVIAVASHEVQSIDEIWIDNEKAWAGGSVLGRYAGYLTVAVRTVGTSGNGVAIDGKWASSCTLTGCSYVVLSFKLTGNSSSAQSPFQSGVSNRLTIRGKGGKVYDPRLDSTVVGGSGMQRASDQTTWAWNDNASRNPALQLLFYLLGWKINGKLAIGMGLPVARIDLPSFITAANLCDESVTLNGGGTEPRYRCDGVLSEGDDRQAVIETLCSQMNATLRDAGGKLALTVIHNDLAAPVASFTETDILQGGSWKQTPPLHETFNIVRGQRIDPSDTALYQPVDFPEVSLASPDGIDRIDTVQYQHVQSNGQAQRLAKQRLQRNQYQGRYSFTAGERWWQVNIGDVVQLSHASFGWANKLFRLVEQAVDPTGPVKVTLLEESAAIYQWDNNEAAAVTPGTPTIYDPLNNPLLQLINGTTGALGDGNRVRFSRFEGGLRGWANLFNPVPLGGLSLGTSIDAPTGKPYVALSGTFTTAAQTISLGSNGSLGGQVDYRIPVVGGERIWAGAKLGLAAPAGSTWAVKIGFIKADGSLDSEPTIISGTGAITFPAIEGDFVLVPVAAVTAWLEFYCTSGASGAFSMILSEPLVVGAGNFQTNVPAFSPGPSNEYAADVTASVVGPASADVLYDNAGTTFQSADDLTYRVQTATGAVTGGVTMSYRVISGTFNGFNNLSAPQTISVSSGVGTLTPTSLATDQAQLEITAVMSGRTLPTFTTVVNKQRAAAAPSGTGGGGSGTTDVASQSSGFTAINTATFTTITQTLLFTLPAGKSTLRCVVDLQNKYPKNANQGGPWDVEFKVVRGGVDQGSVQHSNPDNYIDTVDVGDGTSRLISSAGTMQYTLDMTGLPTTGATQYSVVVQARVASGTLPTNGVNMGFTGTVTLSAP